MEQLIPPSVLLEYNIRSQTPLLNCDRRVEEPREVIMEVPETEEAIRAFLIAAGEKPMICQEKGKREKKEMIENKKKLQKIADAAGKKLVYVKDFNTILVTPPAPKRVSSKKAQETS
jgi:hypothetical protein